MKSEILPIIYDCFDELALEFPAGPVLAKEPGEALFGRHGKLDSLGLVNLIVIVTEKLHARYGISVSLVDEKAFSQGRSPFRTAESLADHVVSLMEAIDVR